MIESLVDADTEFGPTVIPNGPDVLRDLLHDFESRVLDQGAPIDNQLGDGLEPQVVADKLSRIGLVPPEELLVWFGWHNGLVAPQGGRIRMDALPLCIIPSDIDRAISRYYTEADADHEEGRWDCAPGWLMLSYTHDGPAMHCGEDPQSAPRVRSADMENPLWADTSQQEVVSLCTAVTYWIRCLDLGVYAWDRDSGEWAYRPARIPLPMFRTGLCV